MLKLYILHPLIQKLKDTRVNEYLNPQPVTLETITHPVHIVYLSAS